MNALLEAFESASHAIARDPESASTAESVAWMIDQIDQFLASPRTVAVARLDPRQLDPARGLLAEMVQGLFEGFRDMCSVALQIEQQGGRASWGPPLAEAIDRLERAFVQLGIWPNSSRKTPPPVVRRTETLLGIDWSVHVDVVRPSQNEATMNDAGDPRTLIHFIAGLGGSGLSKIRLIKFMYLADVHEFQHRRRRATPYRWRFYHYGPWAMEAQQDIDACVGTGLLDTTAYAREPGGTELVLYRARSVPGGLGSPYSATLEAALRYDVAHWSRQPLNVFLNYVYFDTPPMRNARRGDYLRFDADTFGSAEPEEPPSKRHTTRQARTAFERLLSQRRSLGSVPIPKDAIIDDAYEDAVSALDVQDEIRDLRANVEINPDQLSSSP